jgi:hypothetical protein
MAVNKVDIYVSQIMEDLNNGLTWLERDDLGYGSIEEKYNANPVQIATIRKHPKLKDAETSITIFNVIDDIDDTTNKTQKSTVVRTKNALEQQVVHVVSQSPKMEINTSNTTNEAANIFAQL